MDRVEIIEVLSQIDIYDEYADEAITAAIAALREQEQREQNEPLTLEQLKQMNGEPVWIAEGKFWALVLVRPYNVALICNDGETVNAEGWIKHMGPVYRYKPGGADHE